MPGFAQADVSEPLGWGSGEAATTEKEFFMSDACGWKWNPWLVCPGAKIWTPGLKEGFCWKNSRPPYVEIGQWDFFNLHLVLGRSSWKSTERNVSELNDGRGKKSWMVVFLQPWKAPIECVKRRFKSCWGEHFWASLGGRHSTNICNGVFAVTSSVSLWKKGELRCSKPPRGSQKGHPSLTRTLFHLLFPVQKAVSNPLNIYNSYSVAALSWLSWRFSAFS